jgi:hypothetical protein
MGGYFFVPERLFACYIDADWRLIMNDQARAILDAVAAYHANTTPDALRKAERDSESRGSPQSADQIEWSAKMAFLDAIDAIGQAD